MTDNKTTRGKKTEKRRKIAHWLLLILCVAVFLFSGTKLLRYYSHSREKQTGFDVLRALKETEAAQRVISDTDAAGTVPNPEEQETERFSALLSKNSDFVGWITIDGTGVDYPVMHTPDNPEYYLKHDFDKQYSDWGVPFLAGICDVNRPSDNLIVFGHHMKDGSMFSDLEQYLDSEFAEQHPLIHFDTIHETGEYRVAYVLRTQASAEGNERFAYYQASDFPDAASFDAFIERASALSLFDTGVLPVYGDRLLTLSTCEYSQENGRLVIVARKVE